MHNETACGSLIMCCFLDANSESGLEGTGGPEYSGVVTRKNVLFSYHFFTAALGTQCSEGLCVSCTFLGFCRDHLLSRSL